MESNTSLHASNIFVILETSFLRTNLRLYDKHNNRYGKYCALPKHIYLWSRIPAINKRPLLRVVIVFEMNERIDYLSTLAVSHLMQSKST